MSEHSPQNEMAPEDVVAWLNKRFNGTLMGQIGIKMLEVALSVLSPRWKRFPT